MEVGRVRGSFRKTNVGLYRLELIMLKICLSDPRHIQEERQLNIPLNKSIRGFDVI